MFEYFQKNVKLEYNWTYVIKNNKKIVNSVNKKIKNKPSKLKKKPQKEKNIETTKNINNLYLMSKNKKNKDEFIKINTKKIIILSKSTKFNSKFFTNI